MDRNKQLELIVLAIGWLVAVMIQFFITELIAIYISHHWITNGLIASYDGWRVPALSVFRNPLFVGLVLSGSLGWLIVNTCKNELVTVFFLTVIIGAVLFIWQYGTGKIDDNWVNSMLFIECTPLCAVVWKLSYKYFSSDNDTEVNKTESAINDVKGANPEINPKPVIPAVVIETKEPKQELKPVEQPPKPAPKPPVKPVQRAGWRTKL